MSKNCTPTEPGYYWATHRQFGWRAIVEIGVNGFKHMRAFTPRFSSSSFDIGEFHEYSARLVDPKKGAKP